jgi:hypothetical protein
LLLHIAAGTDPLTALAALPPDEEKPKPPWKSAGCLVALIVLALLTVVPWL